jgi:hypothetical protein
MAASKPKCTPGTLEEYLGQLDDQKRMIAWR